MLLKNFPFRFYHWKGILSAGNDWKNESYISIDELSEDGFSQMKNPVSYKQSFQFSLVFALSFVNFTGCKNQFRLVTDMQEFNINLLRYNFIFSVYMVLILALLWCRLRVRNHQSCKCATNMSKEKWCLEQLVLKCFANVASTRRNTGNYFHFGVSVACILIFQVKSHQSLRCCWYLWSSLY